MGTEKSHNTKYLVIIMLFAVAFGLRLGAINNTTFEDALSSDAGYYYLYALNLKHHHTHAGVPFHINKPPKPDAVRQPLYPLFLTPFIELPPSNFMFWKIMLAQALLGSLTVVLSLMLFRLFMPETWSAIAAAGVAISPHLVSMTTYMLSETLFIFVLMLALYLLAKSVTAEQRKYAFLAGAVLALAVLTRPTVQYLIIPLLLVLLVHSTWRKNVKYALPLLLGYCIIISPWLVRNLYTIGHTSDPTLTINTLHHGMYPNFRYQEKPESTGVPYVHDPHSQEISANTSTVLKEISRRFKEEPALHLKWFLLGKPVSLFSWDIVQGMGDVFVYDVTRSPYLYSRGDTETFAWNAYSATHAAMKTLHWPLVAASLITSLLVWVPAFGRRINDTALFPARLLSILIIYYVLVHMVGAPFPRYGIPLRPATYGLAIFLCYRCHLFLMMQWQKTQLSTSGGLRK